MNAVVVSVIDSIALSNIVTEKIVGKESHPYVISQETGAYVASPNIEDLKEVTYITKNESPEFQPIIERILIILLVETVIGRLFVQPLNQISLMEYPYF